VPPRQARGKTITEYRRPDKKDTDLVFAVYQNRNIPNPDFLYDDVGRSFAKTLDRSGKGDREAGNQRRRQISLHSFRRFVKTTISDLGYADFSEWFIGHSGSTYRTRKDSEKAEIFRKIELSDILECSPVGKTRGGHTKQGRRIRTTKRIHERS
jgi:hypothetical protein